MHDRQPIPNLNIGQVYDQRYCDAEIHYDRLGNLAGFFGRDMSVHRHDRFFQVHYVKSGSVRVHLDDQLFREDGPVFFLTPPTIPHAFATDADSDGHVLTVRQQLVWNLIEADPSLARGPMLAPACVAWGQLDDAGHERMQRIDGLFEALRTEMGGEQAGHAPAVQALTQLLLIELLRLSSSSAAPRPARHEDLHVFHRFNELIEAHYLEHWPLSRYADAMGVTEARLNDICRRIADLPSKRLVFERLMQEARRLLVFTGSSANEICYQLGFKDPAYFSRFFQRHARMTPGEYRHQHAQGR